MPNVRIKDQTTDTALTTGDYVIVDSETEGTRKYDLGALAARVEALEQGGSGMTQAEKQLILTLFCKAAYAEDDAGVVYDALEALWTTTTRTITYNLSHVSSSNTTASVESGQSYTTTLTASTNYTLNSVSVTMGGVDITSTAYSSGTVSIPSVTGNIVITATAVLAAQSITAVYTQSGTVYDTDSLDSLKADLVVTANYSGGTSETVPANNYTLSGTLTVGTSTITVSYAGLTDTFNVTVTENARYTFTMSDGSLSSIQHSNATNSDNVLYLASSTSNTRRTIATEIANTNADVWQDSGSGGSDLTASGYYGIKVPSDATSVAVNITPSNYYISLSGLKIQDGTMVRTYSGSWTAQPFTESFVAGTYDYIVLTCKYGSSGGVITTAAEITNATITFS